MSLSMWLDEGRRVLKVEMRERWGSGGVSPNIECRTRSRRMVRLLEI